MSTKELLLHLGVYRKLRANNGSITNIMLVASGNPYILSYSLPLNDWANAILIGRDHHTFFGLGSGAELEFAAVFGTSG